MSAGDTERAAARKVERERRMRELTAGFDAEIAAMKARHAAERDGLLARIEEAFRALRAEERDARAGREGGSSDR